jgi:hypothetical protein
MSELLNYDINFSGDYIQVDFSGGTDNFLFEISNITFTRDQGDEVFIIASNNQNLFLNYTLDNGNTSGNLDDYIENLLDLINTQRGVIKNTLTSATCITNVLVTGRNDDVDTGTVPEDVWDGGGVYSGHPTGSPETIEVISSSGNDTSGGTGAQTVRITGLKTNTSSIYETEDLTMNGAGGVTSINSWYRIIKTIVLIAGSTGSNVGTITVRHSVTTANVFDYIVPTYNESTSCVYTVPHNTTGYIDAIQVTFVRASGGSGNSAVTFRARDTDNGGVYRTLFNFDISHYTPINLALKYPLQLTQLTDIKLTVENVSSNNSHVYTRFNISVFSNDCL